MNAGAVRNPVQRAPSGRWVCSASRSTFLDRFWGQVDVRGPDECWLWTGSKATSGYGRVQEWRRPPVPAEFAHRLSWMLAHTLPAPAGMDVCHRCDVRLCVNPAHLFLGTRADNLADAARKGRLRRVLSDAQVIELRAAYANGTRGQKLAARFGITKGAAYDIATRRERRHVP